MESFIRAENLTVEFPIYENSHRSLKKAMLNATTGGRIGRDSGSHPVVCAIDNLSFEIKEGERIGLVGHNGSGKTTLLRALTGVYAPSSGLIRKKGKVTSLLDVSLGLDQDATGFENIYLRGVIDGLRPAAIKDRIEEIADFTDLGDYMSFPVRTYSSGMMVRLAFAISTSIEADILIMDEWLSVGDINFSEKATERLKKLVDKASILVIASHSPDIIKKLCNRTLHLEHGRFVKDEYFQTDVPVSAD